MVPFAYSDDLLARFPAVAGGIVVARGVRNGPAPPALAAAYAAEQAAVRERLAGVALGDLPSLAAWRRAFTAFGVEPTRYRSAAEALLRRLVKQGEIPGLSLLVDLGNLVSIRHALPVAVIDLGGVAGSITVRPATGEEPFVDLGGGGAVEHPEPGEIVFVDEAGVVHARRWCWRQSAASATREATTDVLAAVEAHHEGGAAAVAAAADELEGLLRTHAGAAEAERAVLPG